MRAHFSTSKAQFNCSHVPQLAEVFMYQYDPTENLWDIRIGDGKTPAKDLPRLANYDIYERVSKLEQELTVLKDSLK